MPNEPKSTYGVWQELRVLRERSGWSSAALSAQSGVKPPLLSMVENGHRWPTPNVTKKLADAMKVPYSVLERPAEQKESVA